MSVIVVDAVERVNSQGTQFTALIVQSDLEIVTSSNGNLYASVKKASLPCTVELEIAKRTLIGKELPGCIQKVEVPPFEHVNSDGEIVHLNHRWQYVPESHLTEQQAREVEELEELEVETV
ncbi:hypothetical protein D1614_09540 [Maribellus luteus]|uniref:Uncharacterized protein n=1 Tax=Maribellus luteus TaxID=2305463 RepID=A0A399T3J4_9BACT|nr:hypothetical protein [Maribellus luteus]RIJ48761.1 hypothetical protein D1614_09540 [Maribellus luteus]